MNVQGIPIGPFDLLTPIGRGGMGVVWEAVHRERGLTVAVKVLTSDGARLPFYLSSFSHEVRAVAGLDHPHIALVYDYGEIPASAEVRSGGELVAGSPFLVMEHADGGSLATAVGRLGWYEVRDTLLALLDALAHAHARGVVHRDLKPENVLVLGPDATRPGVKLADFGLALATDDLDAGARGGVVVGTPLYMAPEQRAGAWRDFGPWTDLYALGRLALALLTGAPRVPASGQVPGPEGVGAWLARLLEPEPEARFMRAADAAWALLALEGPPERRSQLPVAGALARMGGWSGGRSGGRSGARSGEPPPRADVTWGPTRVSAGAISSEGPEGELPEPGDRSPPPLPRTWRWSEPTSASSGLGAGLGVYGLRTVPLVGREDERDALWEALHRVVQDGRPRAVALRGPAGCGKSRLAEWLCEKAHELGAAHVLRAVHGPLPGSRDGLGPALARWMVVTGLSHRGAYDRVRRLMTRGGVVDEEEVSACTALVMPDWHTVPGGDLPAVRFQSAIERYSVMERLIRQIGRDRPVVLWIDDAQWGQDALGFAAHLLAGAPDRPVPALLVLTAQEESLSERPVEAALLAGLRPHTVPVGPLSEDSRLALVRSLLAMEGELVARVTERTAGNPLFAVQLVGDWVQRGLLTSGPWGFRLRSSAPLSLPEDLGEVWSARLGRLLEGRPEPDAWSLELAAVLGIDVEMAEWRRAAATAGLAPAAALVEAMLRERLARAGADGPGAGWSFVHPMLREAVVARAASAGRLATWHRAAATTLRERAGPGVVERLGRHLLGAGAEEEALEPLLAGAEERYAAGPYGVARDLLSLRERALERTRVARSDARWVQGWLVWSRLSRRDSDLAEAGAWAARAERMARRHGHLDALGDALTQLGKIAREQGDLTRAEGCFREAASLLAGGAPGPLADVRMNLGKVLEDRGDLAASWDTLLAARRDAAASEDDDTVASVELCLGLVARQCGRLAEAEMLLDEARTRFERCGSRGGVAHALNALGEVARLQGELSRADQRYAASVERYQALGASDGVFPLLNRGLVLVERGRPQEARRALETALDTFVRQGRRPMVGAVHACLMPCVAGVGDWGAFDRHADAAERLLAETSLVDVDIATMARHAARAAESAGEPARARRAWALSAAQWAALGRPTDAQEAVDGAARQA